MKILYVLLFSLILGTQAFSLSTQNSKFDVRNQMDIERSNSEVINISDASEIYEPFICILSATVSVSVPGIADLEVTITVQEETCVEAVKELRRAVRALL